jgi:hypothetical protein
MATVKIPEVALREMLSWAADVVTDVVKKIAVEMTLKRYDTPALGADPKDYPEPGEVLINLKPGDTVSLKPGEEFEIAIRW